MSWLSIFKRKPKPVDKWKAADAQPDPEPGQWWFLNDEEGPFSRPRFIVKIVEVRDGWVRYDRGGSSILRFDHKKIDSFKWLYKMVEPFAATYPDSGTGKITKE